MWRDCKLKKGEGVFYEDFVLFEDREKKRERGKDYYRLDNIEVDKKERRVVTKIEDMCNSPYIMRLICPPHDST